MTRTNVKRIPILGNISGAGAYTYLGITLAGSVLGLFFLGYWIDGALGTSPWLAIGGAFIGATGGFINLVLTMNNIQEISEQREREKAEGDSATGDNRADDHSIDSDRTGGSSGGQ